MTWPQLIEYWNLLEYDFARLLHVDLEDSLGRSWRWFCVRLAGILSEPTSLIHNRFRKDDDE